MKIKNAFISNSSSTSFIIAYKNSKPCEHCGRADFDVIDFFKLLKGCESEESRLLGENFIEIVESLNEEIKEIKEELENPNIIYDKYRHMNNLDMIRYKKDELKDCENRLANITKFKDSHPTYKIVSIEVSYHDKLVQEFINFGIKKKSIITLEMEGDIQNWQEKIIE